jgi:hypothetical protein
MQSTAFVAVTGYTGKVENRLISVSSSVSQIEGEENLTFDGSTLTVTGGASITGTLTLAATALTVTGAELNFVDGVTSDIQVQLDAKQASIGQGVGTSDSPTFAGLSVSGDVSSLGSGTPADGYVLTYSTANSRWEAQASSGGGGGGASADDENTVLHMQVFA